MCVNVVFTKCHIILNLLQRAAGETAKNKQDPTSRYPSDPSGLMSGLREGGSKGPTAPAGVCRGLATRALRQQAAFTLSSMF